MDKFSFQDTTPAYCRIWLSSIFLVCVNTEIDKTLHIDQLLPFFANVCINNSGKVTFNTSYTENNS